MNRDVSILPSGGYFWSESSSTPPYKLHRVVEHFLMTLRLPGDVAEFGAFRGETTKNLGGFLQFANIDKKVHAFESFEGLDRPGEHDKFSTVEGINSIARECVTEGVVCKAKHIEFAVNTKGLPVNIYLGHFDEWIGKFDKPLCFAYIDADLYQSTKDAIEVCSELIVPGGCMFFDDFGADAWWPGVKKAVYELEVGKWVLIEVGEPYWQCAAWRKL